MCTFEITLSERDAERLAEASKKTGRSPQDLLQEFVRQKLAEIDRSCRGSGRARIPDV